MLAGEGKHFNAGADLQWMQRASTASEEWNLQDARRFAAMLARIEACPKPTVARVQGAALGGGVGLACACDIAIAADNASFSVSEAKFGILPAVIGPYVTNAVGRRQARRLALTTTRIGAAEALAIGLVQQVVAAATLDAAVDATTRDLLVGGPHPQAEIKQLFAQMSVGPITPEVRELSARTISSVRGTAEAQERLRGLPRQTHRELDSAMSVKSLGGANMLVIGAGIMGAGIAQVAAQAGHRVRLYDTRDGAAAADAKRKLAATFDGLVGKGKIAPAAATATLARIEPIAALAEAQDCGLVVEAIVENLEIKRSLLKQLEAVVAPDCVLATNTSSISVTALANGMMHPQRLVGMHFFNPVPLMKLVEVVSGLHTDAAVAAAIHALSTAWGKVPVHTKSTPGFIVNRIARPYYAETLALLQERAAEPQVLDACLKGAGFRMGPCELMDLIGHDTNFAVTNSAYEANFFDKRFVPSLVQRELVDGGLLGRKTGRGFYRYGEGAVAPSLPVAVHEAPHTAREVTVHGEVAIADWLERATTTALAAQGWGPAREPGSGWVGLVVDGAHLVLTDGRPAHELVAVLGTDDVAVFDRPILLPAAPGTALAYALAPSASEHWQSQAPAWFAALGFAPQRVADTPGLVVARAVAMLINKAADAVQQGVCTPQGADTAIKLGVNYPAGPFEWLAAWDRREVIDVLDSLDAAYRGERYRASPWLRRGAV